MGLYLGPISWTEFTFDVSSLFQPLELGSWAIQGETKIVLFYFLPKTQEHSQSVWNQFQSSVWPFVVTLIFLFTAKIQEERLNSGFSSRWVSRIKQRNKILEGIPTWNLWYLLKTLRGHSVNLIHHSWRTMNGDDAQRDENSCSWNWDDIQTDFLTKIGSNEVRNLQSQILCILMDINDINSSSVGITARKITISTHSAYYIEYLRTPCIPWQQLCQMTSHCVR